MDLRSGKELREGFSSFGKHGLPGVHGREKPVATEIGDLLLAGAGEQLAFRVVNLEHEGVVELGSDERVAVEVFDSDENLAVGSGAAERGEGGGGIGLRDGRGQLAVWSEPFRDSSGNLGCHGSLRGSFHTIGNTKSTAGDADEFGTNVALAEGLSFIHASNGHRGGPGRRSDHGLAEIIFVPQGAAGEDQCGSGKEEGLDYGFHDLDSA